MELRHLRYFVAVAEELHFGRAARRLHLAQPPLSQQIKSLENELKVALLIRTSRKVELTAAGQLFLDQSRLVLAQAAKALETMQASGRGELGSITIGFAASSAYTLVPKILREFHRSHALVELRCHEMYALEQTLAFHERRLHLGFTRAPLTEPTLNSVTLSKEGFVVATPSDHPLAQGKGPLPLRDLAGEGFILFPRSNSMALYDGVIASCLRAGFSPRLAQEGSSTHSILALVAAGLGIALVPLSLQNLRHPGVVYRELAAGDSEEIDITLNWRKDDQSPLVHAFIAAAKAIAGITPQTVVSPAKSVLKKRPPLV